MFPSMSVSHINTLLNDFVHSGQLPLVSAMVWQGDRQIYRFQQGEYQPQKAVSDDTLFRIFSMTKVITATALLILYERGQVLLDDPVYEYLPSFRNQTVFQIDGQGNRNIVPADRPNTLKNLLTMTSGIPYYHPGRSLSTDLLGEVWARMDADIAAGRPWGTMRMMDEIGRTPLQFHPGEKFQYGLGIDIIGGVIEVVSGRRLGDFFKEEILLPLGMTDTDFFAPPEKQNRLSLLFTQNKDGSYISAERFQDSRQLSRPAYEEGGDGLLTTIGDYMRFARMLLGEGTLDRVRILGRKTVALMTANHLNSAQLPYIEYMPNLKGYGYGLGVRVMLDRARASLNTSEGEFGWYGMGGSWFCVDPVENLIAIFLTQKAPNNIQLTVPRFVAAVYGNLV
jgi:CubicO group peptidase (beta-lactamase class C family)